MKLSELLKDASLRYTILAPDGADASFDPEISAVVNNTANLAEGCLFICIRGANFDGHSAVQEAADAGCAAVLVQEDVTLENAHGMLVVRVDDTRYAMALVSGAWFHHPARRLKTIGVTGTKGKTTTTYLIRNMLEQAGIKTGLIGTIEYITGSAHLRADNTTPESYTLQELLARMADEGCEAVVMEVSSQALMLHRSAGIEFDIGIFTNIEPDHIGQNEHKDFDDYLRCKSLLFRQCKTGIVNCDDAHAEEVLQGHTCEIETYGFSEQADLRAVNLAYIHKPGALGVFFDTKGLLEMHAEIANPGRFSVLNALCAIAVARHFRCDAALIANALKGAKVKGRIEMVPVNDRYTLMIDYAHNAMALKSLLTTLRDYRPARLICLFGCGGNRARDRRFAMGEVSGRYADLTIITSDNPRNEEPEAIMADIKTGIEKTDGEYVEIADRREAIRYAMENAEDGDIIVLAGKGHEDYQEIKGVKYPMDERVIVREIASTIRHRD